MTVPTSANKIRDKIQKKLIKLKIEVDRIDYYTSYVELSGNLSYGQTMGPRKVTQPNYGPVLVLVVRAIHLPCIYRYRQIYAVDYKFEGHARDFKLIKSLEDIKKCSGFQLPDRNCHDAFCQEPSHHGPARTFQFSS